MLTCTELAGYRIALPPGRRGGTYNKRRAFYVLDRAYCHKIVQRFSNQARPENAKREAERACAELNAT